VTQIDALAQGQRLGGYTGDLELDINGRIQRVLDWAQYEKGESIGVERIEAQPVPLIRSGAPN